MEISSGISNPVNIYKSVSDNNLNPVITGENKLYQPNNFFISGITATKNDEHKKKRKRKNRRLNTIDTEFLSDEAIDSSPITQDLHLNFFVEKQINPYKEKLKKSLDYFFTSIPLINYFYLKHKGHKIQQTVKTLNNIIQNADDLINTTVPYGENNRVYQNIAQNLTNAAIIIGKANREFEKDYTEKTQD